MIHFESQPNSENSEFCLLSHHIFCPFTFPFFSSYISLILYIHIIEHNRTNIRKKTHKCKYSWYKFHIAIQIKQTETLAYGNDREYVSALKWVCICEALNTYRTHMYVFALISRIKQINKTLWNAHKNLCVRYQCCKVKTTCIKLFYLYTYTRPFKSTV